MSFEANRGQTDKQVQFISRGPGYALFITPTEAVFSLPKAVLHAEGKNGVGHGAHTLSPASGVSGTLEKARSARPTANSLTPSGQHANKQDGMLAVRMLLVGANPNAKIAGLDELPGKVNYLKRKDPKQWQTGVATYGKFKLNGVYDGVDLVCYGNGRQLEYDFIVAPGADPKAIRLNFNGTDKARFDVEGDLLLHTKDGELRFVLYKPRCSRQLLLRRLKRLILVQYLLHNPHGCGECRYCRSKYLSMQSYPILSVSLM